MAVRRVHGAAAVVAALFLMVAGPPGGGAAAGETGLPVPRFVSLRADEVNLRTGPGIQYPVDWVYRHKHLPMEVVAEYRTWRKVRDWQGTEGWVHQSMLDGRRTVIVIGERRTLRTEPHEAAAAVARLEPGVVALLLTCPPRVGWCQVEAAGRRGWLAARHMWGVHGGEVVE